MSPSKSDTHIADLAHCLLVLIVNIVIVVITWTANSEMRGRGTLLCYSLREDRTFRMFLDGMPA